MWRAATRWSFWAWSRDFRRWTRSTTFSGAPARSSTASAVARKPASSCEGPPGRAEIANPSPSVYRLALQAMNKGRPLVLDAQHDLSKAYPAFAGQLAGVRAPAPPVEKVRAGGLFGRLAPRKA